MKTPVLIIAFNRPETATQLINSLRLVKPLHLFIYADGPRDDKDGEKELCRSVLECFDRLIDWPCTVERQANTRNLGCKHAVSSAITWFFTHVDEGIILEDDCIPNTSFFTFCSDMLEHYRDNPRITHIGGFNCQNGNHRGSASYYFSHFFHVWGWATWRRAWAQYDVNMSDFDEFITQDVLFHLFGNRQISKFWNECFEAVYRKGFNTWDYQWVYSNFKNDRLSIIPNANLINNVGFGDTATHTKKAIHQDSIASMGPITHPSYIIADRTADEFTYANHLGVSFLENKSLAQLIMSKFI